jgi:hypothetical protein
MEFQLVVSAPPDSHPFELWVEPEGMMYELPATGPVVLAFRGADAMAVELCHRPNAVVIWRPPDTEVWATTPDGVCEQIAGCRDIPFPGLDSGGAQLSVPGRVLIEKIFHDRPTIDGKRLGPTTPDQGIDRARDGQG